MEEEIGSTDNVTCYICGYVLPMDLYMNIRTCPNCSPPLPTLQQRLERAREEILRNQRARAVERQKELNLMIEDSKRIKELWGLVCWYVSGNPRRLLKP